MSCDFCKKTVLKRRRAYLKSILVIILKPIRGNKEGELIPMLIDRGTLTRLILRDITLPKDKAKMTSEKHRAAKGCSKRARAVCPDCGLNLTSLVRHNCKGLSDDGGLVARRQLRYCPVCKDQRGIFTDLPRHIRNVIETEKVHGFERDITRRITSSYTKNVRSYNRGTLQKTKVWKEAIAIARSNSSVLPTSVDSSAVSADSEQPEESELVQNCFDSSASSLDSGQSGGRKNIHGFFESDSELF